MSKMVKIQAELKAPKGQFNNFAKYKYRSCEDIVEAVKPVLAKYDCWLNITDDIVGPATPDGRVYVKAIASVMEDNQVIATASAFAREPLTKKGMDESQITGAASSYARKYALNGLFAIDDGVDADSTNTHGKETKRENKTEKVDLTRDQFEALVKIAEKAGLPELANIELKLDDYSPTGPNVKKARKVIDNKFKSLKDESGK